MSDFDVLVVLSEHPEQRLRITELATAIQWERSRLSHHLTRMEKRGLVDRAACEDDRRGAFVALTGAGRLCIEGAAPGHVRAVRRLFLGGLDKAEFTSLGRGLAALVAHLEAELGDDG